MSYPAVEHAVSTERGVRVYKALIHADVIPRTFKPYRYGQSRPDFRPEVREGEKR